jgi:pullulanase
MYEEFGAFVSGSSVEFRLFFPDSAVDPTQYSRGGLPHIASIRVTGTFQSAFGQQNWDYNAAPELKKKKHPKGMLYTCKLPNLPDDFYQYKYYVSFTNGTTRWCTDPCTKYGSAEMENSAFVVGGNDMVVPPINHRLPQQDLVIYELNIDDFTAQFRGNSAPLDAVRQKIGYLKELGVNAVEFMPFTSWYGGSFSWGYDPYQFFAVEYCYTNDNGEPLDKLFRLKRLIGELHAAGIHVIMDGVFNHTQQGEEPGRGFGYYWLYENPADSPYTGDFAGGGYFKDLNFANGCTQEFITDVCQFWLQEYRIDGIRFDYTLGYYDPAHLNWGITELCQALQQSHAIPGQPPIPLMLEHLTDNRYAAIDVTNQSSATGCWFDPMLFKSWDCIASQNIDPGIMRVLNASKDFAVGKGPVTYIENHDHPTIVNKAGGRPVWWKVQPYAIALFMCPGTPLIYNGQEFARDAWMPDSGAGRVAPRPLDWSNAADTPGVAITWLFQKLIAIRIAHPALRSPNFYPESYDPYFNSEGYGANIDQDVVIFHRWGDDGAGGTDQFIIVCNFSSSDQFVDIPFPSNGEWTDLLNDRTDMVNNFRLWNQKINPNWGRIYYKKG